MQEINPPTTYPQMTGYLAAAITIVAIDLDVLLNYHDLPPAAQSRVTEALGRLRTAKEVVDAF